MSTDLAKIPGAPLAGVERNPVTVYLQQLSKGSAETMRSCLLRIAKRYSYQSPEQIAWDVLTAGDIAALKNELAGKYAPSSANLHLQAVRGVVRAAWQEGIITAEHRDRLLSVKLIQGSRVSPGRALSEEEFVALFRAAQGQKGPIADRDTALLALMVAGGLRVHEPCKLEIADLLPAPGRVEQLRVRGKGNKERLVPLVPGAAAALSAWLKERTLLHGGPVFHPVANHGRIRRDSPLTVSSATAVFLKLGRMAGVQMSTHNFRRTVGSNLLAAGVDLAIVQRLFGHASPSTTVKYDRRPHDAVTAAVVANVKVPYVELALSPRHPMGLAPGPRDGHRPEPLPDRSRRAPPCAPSTLALPVAWGPGVARAPALPSVRQDVPAYRQASPQPAPQGRQVPLRPLARPPPPPRPGSSRAPPLLPVLRRARYPPEPPRQESEPQAMPSKNSPLKIPRDLNNRRAARWFCAEARRRKWMSEALTFEQLDNHWKLDEHLQSELGLARLFGLTARPHPQSDQARLLAFIEDRLRGKVAGPRRRVGLHAHIDATLDALDRPVVEDVADVEEHLLP